MSYFAALWADVIKKGLCTCCGTCIGVCPANVLEFDEESEQPRVCGKCIRDCRICYDVCPGKDVPLPALERMIFGRERNANEEMAGISQSHRRSYAIDPQVRKAGASGDCTTACLVYALEYGIIDSAVVAAMSDERPWKVEPRIATTRLEIIQSARSKYVVFPHNKILREITGRGFKKVGYVGLPCHISCNTENAAKKIHSGGDKIRLVLGLACGSNTSFKATEHTIREWAGIDSISKVTWLDYRAGRDKSDVEIKTENQTVVVPRGIWYHRAFFPFQRERCVMCYDFGSELADVSFGDCSPGGIRRVGWSHLAVRSDEGMKLIEGAEREGYIKTFPIEQEEFLDNLGFEIKKHGGLSRLNNRRRFGWPTPDYGVACRFDIERGEK